MKSILAFILGVLLTCVVYWCNTLNFDDREKPKLEHKHSFQDFSTQRGTANYVGWLAPEGPQEILIKRQLCACGAARVIIKDLNGREKEIDPGFLDRN